MKKKQNFKSEEHFHDEWAHSVSIKELDIEAQFNGSTGPEYKQLVDYLGDVKGKKVLNLGCGLGEEAVYLAKLGANVVAIDISKGMIDATKKLAKKYKVEKKITYHQMDAEKLTFKDNSFDGIAGCNILHHVNIKKSIKEVKRVLKKNGVAVFSEPLIYNPVINVYRAMADQVRTDHERPLNDEDMAYIKKVFPKMKHKEFHLFTLLIFVWFFVGERLHPNKARYWKKILTEAKKYEKPFKVLHGIDRGLFAIVPFLQKYCWVTVIRVEK